MTGKSHLRDLNEVLRDSMFESDRIARVLRAGPKTLPELSVALSVPVPEVTLWVMTLRRYGRIRELPKGREEDYYRYGWVEGGP